MRIVNYLNNSINNIITEYNNLDKIVNEVKYAIHMANIQTYDLSVEGKYLYLKIDEYNIVSHYELPVIAIRTHEIKNILN